LAPDTGLQISTRRGTNRRSRWPLECTLKKGWKVIWKVTLSLLLGCEVLCQVLNMGNCSISYPSMQLYTWLWNYIHTSVWNYILGCETTHLGMQLHTWVWNYIPGYETTYLGVKLHT
jgi:hypothetical protein